MRYERRQRGLLRPDQAAQELGWSIADVLRACRSGLIKGAHKTHAGWFMPEAEILRMAAEMDARSYIPRWKREEIYAAYREMLEMHGLGNGYVPEPREED